MSEQANIICELYESIIANDFNKIKNLVENGINLHQDNDTAFLIASYFGNIKIIDYLLSKGADINAFSIKTYDENDRYYLYGNALSLAIDNSQWRAFDYLLEKGINLELNDSLALKRVISKGELERVKQLVRKGAEIHEPNALLITISEKTEKKWEIAQYFIDETTVDIHSNNDFALRFSCLQKNFETVKKLVEKGANVNAITYYGKRIEVGGNNNTPLICSISSNSWEIFEYLISQGADPNINDQEPFIQYCKFSENHKRSDKFLDYYIKNQLITFNKDVFEVVVKVENIDLLKFFLSEYPNIDIDKSKLLENNTIYEYNQTKAFDYLLSEGYELSAITKNMLVAKNKTEFLKIIMKYDLADELPKQNISNKAVKV